nr:hypothetical protein [uncultured Rhodopila sp.]
MTRLSLLAGLALLSLGGVGYAQETGGLGLDPSIKDGPHGLARPMAFFRNPYMTARDVQGGMTAADHQAQDQAMITKLRGDPGYLAGFSMGTPLAASRQPVAALPDDGGYRYRRQHGHGNGPIIINNAGPLAVTVGNGNVVQQQSATGSGPIAQQQVATTPARGASGGGALNLVSGAGNIIQRAPGN